MRAQTENSFLCLSILVQIFLLSLFPLWFDVSWGQLISGKNAIGTNWCLCVRVWFVALQWANFVVVFSLVKFYAAECRLIVIRIRIVCSLSRRARLLYVKQKCIAVSFFLKLYFNSKYTHKECSHIIMWAFACSFACNCKLSRMVCTVQCQGKNRKLEFSVQHWKTHYKQMRNEKKFFKWKCSIRWRMKREWLVNYGETNEKKKQITRRSERVIGDAFDDAWFVCAGRKFLIHIMAMLISTL